MSALTHFFFRSPELSRRTTWDVVAWWESRRPVYNVAVGATGLVSLATVKLFLALPPHPVENVIPLGAVVAWGLLANGFYTTGWLAELGMRRWLGDEVAPAGAALFRYGFVFSIGLTLFPAMVSALSWVARLTSIFR